ncbi:alpha/beta fold hydrolase [Nakamurella leprariae]|uniref:Alpha/beta fold hydrolase n=1 Tax=Nakamurella leprariae TaxID=2803911 RepID=A0A938YE66_9ACTN|nr:alpha/beta fold hydrolase [Nakamurella leprariae]MBM9466792.1 alpha/beta fold hydrolase [Nakamurella leprariae]
MRRWLRTPARRWTTLGVVLAVLALVAVVVWPSAAPARVSSSEQRISAPGGPGVAEPVELDTTLYLPESTPAPAVLLAHGFGGSKASLTDQAQQLARDGFVVLTYSARGFGTSTGQIALDSLDHEIPDARALVDWLAERPEVTLDAPGDPRIGVTGGSYGGALSLMLAGTDPRIDALAPVITWNDLGDALFPNALADADTLSAATPAAAGDAGDGVFKRGWAAALIASVTTGASLTGTLGVAEGDTGDTGFAGPGSGGGGSDDGQDGSAPPDAGTDGSAPTGTDGAPSLPTAGGIGVQASCGRLMLELCAAYSLAAETGRLGPDLAALLERSSPATVAGDITAPTLLVQGERDTLFGLDQADANARAIAANGATVAVSWYNGGHDGGSPDSDTEQRITDWFRHWLAGTGPEPSTAFRYTVDGPVSDTGRARSRTLQAADYPGLDPAAGPTSETPRQPVGLTGSAQVIVNPPGGQPAAVSSLPGLGGLASSVLSTFGGGLPGQTARFTSEPMADLTVLTGTSRVALSISRVPVPALPGTSAATSAADDDPGAVLFASLAKVTPGGVRTLAGGAVAPIRITDLPADGSPATVVVDLPASALQVEAGSSVEVSIATTNQAFAGSTEPSVYRVALADQAAVASALGTAGRDAGAIGLDTASLSAPEVGGERVGDSEIPVPQLVGLVLLAGLVVVALLIGGRRFGRGSSRAPDPALAEVPLAITGLRKQYPGGVPAVQDVSFRVEAGQVLGLLGPNGAGKTTTLRMVMGLISPSAGEIRAFGRVVHPGAEILSRIGSFVEGSGFLPHLSGRANLELYWKATGRPAEDAHMDTALAIAGLGAAVERKVRTYSQGMRQRLAIAQAMLGLPELLLLDEPTNGLDPPQIHAMREVLQRYAATGRTVLVSSHLLSEVEQTCSHVVVMHKGRTIATGTVAELIAGSGETVFGLDRAEDTETTVRVLRDELGLRALEVTEAGVQVDLGRVPASTAVAALVGAGVAVSAVAPRNRLEDVFLAMVGESVDPAAGDGAMTGEAAPSTGSPTGAGDDREVRV